MSKNNKYYLECKKCNHKIEDFNQWFEVKQKCPKCGHNQADVQYYGGTQKVLELIKDKNFKPKSIWGYFDFLPLLDEKNAVTAGGEGIVSIERWEFLEKFAKENYNLSCKVYAHRNDNNHSTGTFKDLAATVVASVLKENGIKNYVAASTGNIGVAYSRYLAAADVSLSAFLPDISLKSQESEIGCFGQKVFRVDGDYARAKELAAQFAEKHNVLLSGGNFDPMRIEAKKTMVYEWLRLMDEFPTVYMQALSGGSGPLGIAKSCKELEGTGAFEKMPRFILTQPVNCAPMAHAWEKAKAENFPENWENDYPVYENPVTDIHTLSTGNPTAYPTLGKLVKESKGEIIEFDEEKTVDIARLVAYELGVRIGPAASITVGGFFKSLQDEHLKDGDVVMVNIGEGTRRSPEFVEKLCYSAESVSTLEECKLTNREQYRQQLLDALKTV